MSPGLSAFKLSFQICPIILTGGIATNIPGGALPIISITEAEHFTGGLLDGSALDLDEFFAAFQPLPGATLVDNQIGAYPFANQSVAANAIIAQPRIISLLMICPARGDGGYYQKLNIMLTLQSALAQHNSMGGTYTVVTPAAFYTNTIMLGMKDVSSGESHQVQSHWQMDFVKPLLTLEEAQQAQNSLMSKLSSGTQVSGQPSWTGASPTVGQPSSLAGPAVVPASSGTAGGNTAPLPTPPIPPAGGETLST